MAKFCNLIMLLYVTTMIHVPAKVYDGMIRLCPLTSDNVSFQIQELMAMQFTSVNGSVELCGQLKSAEDALVTLFQNVTNISGNLTIYDTDLDSETMFTNLMYLEGSLNIVNTSITTIQSFNRLQVLDSLDVYGNIYLTHVSSFNNITHIESIRLWDVKSCSHINQPHCGAIISDSVTMVGVKAFRNLQSVQQSILLLFRASYIFGFDNLEMVGGSLIIKPGVSDCAHTLHANNCSEKTFQMFPNLMSVGADLILENLLFLDEISGFNALEEVGHQAKLFVNAKIFDSMNSLHKLGKLSIAGSFAEFKAFDKLTDCVEIYIDGFETLPRFPTLSILNLLHVTSFQGALFDSFYALESVERIIFEESEFMVDVVGFQILKYIGTLTVQRNSLLKGVGGGSSLTFSTIIRINKLVITDNPLFESLRVFSEINFNSYGIGDIYIHDNAQVPSMPTLVSKNGTYGALDLQCQVDHQPVLSKLQCEPLRECFRWEVQMHSGGCEECSPGYYKLEHNGQCEPHKVCRTYELETVAPTQSSDRVCTYSYWICPQLCGEPTLGYNTPFWNSSKAPCEQIPLNTCTELTLTKPLFDTLVKRFVAAKIYPNEELAYAFLKTTGTGVFYKSYLPDSGDVYDTERDINVSSSSHMNAACTITQVEEIITEGDATTFDFNSLDFTRRDVIPSGPPSECTSTTFKMGEFTFDVSEGLDGLSAYHEVINLYDGVWKESLAIIPVLMGLTASFQTSRQCIPVDGIADSCPHSIDNVGPSIVCPATLALIQTPGMRSLQWSTSDNQYIVNISDPLSDHVSEMLLGEWLVASAADTSRVTALTAIRSDGLNLSDVFPYETIIDIDFVARDLYGNTETCSTKVIPFMTSSTWKNMPAQELFNNRPVGVGTQYDFTIDNLEFFAGFTYIIPGPKLAKEQLFNNYFGNASEIRYSFEIVDTSLQLSSEMLIDPRFGTMSFTAPREHDSVTFQLKLKAEDFAGAVATVHTWNVSLISKPQFQLSEEWNASAIQDQIDSIYAVGDIVETDGMTVPLERLFENPAGGVEAISYRLEVIDLAINTDVCPSNCPGSYFVSGNGGMFLRHKRKGHYSLSLIARDGEGQEISMYTWVFRIQALDTEITEFGPNRKGCENGNPVDGIRFDNSFTCNCNGTLYTGDNCELLPENIDDRENLWIIVGVLIIVTIAGIIFGLWHLRKRRAIAVDFASVASEMEYFNDMTKTGCEMRYPKEIKRGHLTLLEVIGEGHFGSVHKAMLFSSNCSSIVAAKVLHESGHESTTELVQEAMLMAQIPYHPHIVTLLGVVTKSDPFILIASYCENGSLKEFLEKRFQVGPPLQYHEKLRMAKECASGMEELSLLRIVHRDLAARNVLVASDESCMIADFGLSRTQTDEATYYRAHACQLPVRWTAPELFEIDGTVKFSESTDVWSFGILLLEIFDNGAIPYRNWTNVAVIDNVKAGKRALCPDECSLEAYELMQKCWSAPDERPSFTKILKEMDAIRAPRPNGSRASARPTDNSYEYMESLC
eukprot:m.41794 g.41794  ORF g.41794 m.41794 type:complete len:1523 (+) comp9811_c0_seq1:160-4728(+)